MISDCMLLLNCFNREMRDVVGSRTYPQNRIASAAIVGHARYELCEKNQETFMAVMIQPNSWYVKTPTVVPTAYPTTPQNVAA